MISDHKTAGGRTHRIGGKRQLCGRLVACGSIQRNVYLLAGEHLALLVVGAQGYDFKLHGVTGAV